MNAQKSKYHFVGFLAVLALSFGLISLASETKGFSVNGETTVQGCGTILFGSTEYTGGTSASTSSFSTSGIAIPTIEVSSTFAGSASADQTCRIKNGYITFNFDSTVVTRARIYAYKYGTDADGAMTVSSSADTSGALFSVTNGTAPTLTDLSGTGIYDYTAPDGGLGIASTFLKIACSGTSQRVNLCKILLTLNGVASSSSSSLVSSSSSSPSASSSASTSSVSSSSTTPSGTYQFVASENQIASGWRLCNRKWKNRRVGKFHGDHDGQQLLQDERHDNHQFRFNYDARFDRLSVNAWWQQRGMDTFE